MKKPKIKDTPENDLIITCDPKVLMNVIDRLTLGTLDLEKLKLRIFQERRSMELKKDTLDGKGK